jgi:hypothetical protein
MDLSFGVHPADGDTLSPSEEKRNLKNAYSSFLVVSKAKCAWFGAYPVDAGMDKW